MSKRTDEPRIIDLAPMFNDDREWVYYVVETDSIDIQWFNIGDWTSEATGHTYLFIGEL